MKTKQDKKEGFTLVETMVAIVVFSLILLASTALFRIIFLNANANPNALNAVDQAESTATNFVNQVRDASYGNDGSYPLGEASSTEIIFYSPYGAGSSTTVDRIRYYVSGTTLYEGVTAPSGSPSTYPQANEKISTVAQHVAGVGTSTIFFYYNGLYAGTSSALSQPVNINQVTYIGLSMAVQLLQVRNSTASSVISTGAAIRNLKTNLGN